MACTGGIPSGHTEEEIKNCLQNPGVSMLFF
jgi:hypothetical protein